MSVLNDTSYDSAARTQYTSIQGMGKSVIDYIWVSNSGLRHIRDKGFTVQPKLVWSDHRPTSVVLDVLLEVWSCLAFASPAINQRRTDSVRQYGDRCIGVSKDVGEAGQIYMFCYWTGKN